jgi:multidrug efflux system membrane fusion protein
VKDVAENMEFTGNTRATDVVDVRSRVSGYLKKIAFTDGAMVQEGATLFQIETEPFDAALASAQAKLQKAEAVLELAIAEKERTEPLVKKGALSVQEQDIKNADVATAKADVAEARAALKEAELNLQYTTIKAPISGRASRHMVDAGNLVEAEKTMLTRLESYRPIHAYFTVSESEMVRLMELARTARKHEATPANKPLSTVLELGLSGDQGFRYRGELDFMELGIEPGTGTQMRRGVFRNEDLELVPGMFVRVRLQLGEPKPQVLVAERALQGDQQGPFVLVVDEKNLVHKRHVQFGALVGGLRVIRQGLTPKDRVIVNGLQRARPDMPEAYVTPLLAEKMPGAEPAVPAQSAAPSSAPAVTTKE